MSESDQDLTHILSLEEVESLKPIALGESHTATALEEVGDVLHLLEGKRALVNVRHCTGRDDIQKLAEADARLDLFLEGSWRRR